MNKDQSKDKCCITFTVQFGPADLGSIEKILIIDCDSERSAPFDSHWNSLKVTCKGTLRQYLSVFTDWRYSQSSGHFRPSFVNCCPSNLLSGSTLPPPPFPAWIIILYRVLGLIQKTSAEKSFFRSIFLDDNILNWLLWVLSCFAWNINIDITWPPPPIPTVFSDAGSTS